MHEFEKEAMERSMEIPKGRILAKAIIRRKNGEVEAVVVYAGSKPTDFFWTYRLRSPRSPHKTWKSTGFYLRVLNAYRQDTFESWLAAHALGAEIVSVKVYHARKLAELMKKPDREFYGPRQELEAWQVQKIEAKMKTKFRGVMPVFHGAPR